MSEELERAAQRANEIAHDICEELLGTVGGGKEYVVAVTALSTTLFFHLYRLGKPDGKNVEILQAALNDVTHNIQELHGDRIEIIVRRKV